MTSSDVQWYQSPTHVVITVLKRKGLENAAVDATFKRKKCELYLDGSLHWECVLAHNVIADECVSKQTQKRIELKLKKAAPLKWTSYESMDGTFDEASESSDSFDSASAIFGPPPADSNVTGIPAVSESSNELGVGMGLEADNNISRQGAPDNLSNVLTGLSSLSISQKQEGKRFDSATDPGSGSTPVPLPQSLGSGSGMGVVGGRDGTELERGAAKGYPLGVSDNSTGSTHKGSTPTSTPRKNSQVETNGSTPKDNDRDALAHLKDPGPVCVKGHTGLVNLGNTCFMNSVVQCMSHVPALRNFFLTNEYRSDVNRENPLGCEGQLAYSFAALVKKLWNGENEYLYPRNLKHLVYNKFHQFQSLAQQDAQEFMSFFLDRLHEDLNRVREKPTTEAVEGKGRPDVEVADEFWQKHKKRNNSLVESLFLGQFKSTLVCPMCQETSVVFDPFMSVSVPLPQKMLSRSVVFVPQDPEKVPVKYMLKLPEDAKLELLKASVARRTGLPMKTLRVFEAHRGKFQTLMTQNQSPVSRIKPTDTVIVCEVMSETARRKVVEIQTLQRVAIPHQPTKCSSCGIKSDFLKKCSACKQVSYCGPQCQSSDWKFHRPTCESFRAGRKQRGPETTGCPFILSLPESQCNYDNIVKMALKFARRSVDTIEVTPPVNPAAYAAGEVDVAPPTIKLSFVSRFGDTEKANITKGECTAANLRGKFLSMDWQNDEQQPYHVIVTPKDMECQDDISVTQHVVTDDSQPITLPECLQLFTEPEALTENDAWYCPSCKEHREATKQMSIWRLPDILVVHLKRFSQHNIAVRGKLDKFVRFPTRDLDMSPYILGDARKQLDTSGDPALFDLLGVVNHHGAANYGHYTAHVQPEHSSNGEWIHFDDEIKTEVSEARVVTKDAYVLFYKRRNT